MTQPSKKNAFGKEMETPVGQLRFPAIARPESFKDSKPRYGATLIVPANNELTKKLIKAIDDLAVLNFGKDAAMVQKAYMFGPDYVQQMKEPSDATKEFFKDKVKFGANCAGDKPPLCVLTNGNKIERIPGAAGDAILDQIEEQFYPGSIVRLKVTPLAYSHSKTVRGVTLLLKGIQFIADGQRLGGMSNFSSDFDTSGLEAFGAVEEIPTGLTDIDGVNI